MWRLTIPGTFPTFNELLDGRVALAVRAGARGQRANRYTTNKGELQERLALVLESFREDNAILFPLRGPLTLSMIWRGRPRVEPDNRAAGGVKIILDAAVAAKVLQDDSQRTI